jgi:hypothetical protein
MKTILSTIGLCILLALFLLTAATQSGCQFFTSAVNFVYDKGDLNGYVDADIGRTSAATRLAMKDLGFPIVNDELDAEEGKVEGQLGNASRVVMHLVRKAERVTRVNIRVGIFGDEGISRDMLLKIETHLNDPSLRASARVP